jgi:hypothetical protein
MSARDLQRAWVLGWIEAGLYVFAIGVLSLTYMIGARLGVHVVPFILVAMIVSAIAVLVITGLGPDARRILAMPQSWVVGTATIMMEVFYYLLIAEVDAAHASLMVRLAIPLSLVIGFVWLARRPAPLAWAGALVIVGAIVPVLTTLDASARTGALIAIAGCAAMYNLRGFAAEFHPANRAARTVLEKLRLTGLVVLATSIVGIAAMAVATTAMAAGYLPSTRLVPGRAEWRHAPTLLLGTFVGSIVMTAMSYLNYSSVVRITTENFAAVSAFTPPAVWLVQAAAAAASLAAFPSTAPLLLAAMAGLVFGVSLIIFAANRARRVAAS